MMAIQVVLMQPVMLFITQADKTMTGANGWYNTKTQEASLEGGVSLIGSDMAMSAQSVPQLQQ